MTNEEPMLLPEEIILCLKHWKGLKVVYLSFASEGSVLHGGVTETEKQVVLLGDMGTAQTVKDVLLLKDVLPLPDDTYTHKSVLVECSGDIGYQSLPLHRVCLKSKYMTRHVPVGIVDKYLLRVYTFFLKMILQGIVDRWT